MIQYHFKECDYEAFVQKNQRQALCKVSGKKRKSANSLPKLRRSQQNVSPKTQDSFLEIPDGTQSLL